MLPGQFALARVGTRLKRPSLVEDFQRKTSEQNSDYDGDWSDKEGLRHHLAEFLAKYIAARIFEVAHSGVGPCLADVESHLHC
jgi:hypothetical protein